MVKCCKNCKYFENGECAIFDELFENENNIDNIVDYVIGDGIIAEKLNEVLENLNLSDERKEDLIYDIETVIENTIKDENNCFKIKDYRNFKCDKYE